MATARRRPAAGASQRIAKAIAGAGLCSRRDAERWIAEGRVSLNGRLLTSPAVNVVAGDSIAVDGRPLPTRGEVRLWRYHKPEGLVSTHRDPEGRPTVFDRLPQELGRVISVGRLDIASEGLLLLTNSGDLARKLELPATAWTRRYRVRVFGEIDAEALRRLVDGISIDGIRYGPIKAQIDATSGAHAWLRMSLKEGKNREVRRVLNLINLQVSRLIRIGYGPFQLGHLQRGQVDEVQRRILRDQLGRDAVDGVVLGPRS